MDQIVELKCGVDKKKKKIKDEREGKKERKKERK